MHRFAFPLVSTLALVTAAHAESLTRDLDGSALDLRHLCAKRVEVEPDAALSGKIHVEATADRKAEIDALTFAPGSTVGIAGPDRCYDTMLTPATLVVRIRVPARTGIEIAEGGSVDYHLGAIGGGLQAILSGSGHLVAASTANLSYTGNGSADARFDKVEGAANVVVQGSGQADIRDISGGALSGTINGSGSIQVAKGELSDVSLAIRGSGTAKILAAAKNASVTVMGSGDVDLGPVSGNVSKTVMGSGRVNIAGR